MILSDIVHAAAAAILWSIVFARSVSAARERSQRPLWFALVTLAAAQTLQVHPIYVAAEEALEVNGGTSVLKHALALLAAAGVRELVRSATNRTRDNSIIERVALLGCLLLLVAPLVHRPDTVPSGLLDGRAEFYSAAWSWLIHWGALLAYLSWGLIAATRMCLRYAPHATPELRRGLTLIGIGTAVGLGYVVSKVAVLVWWIRDPSPALVRFDIATELVFLGAALGCITTGVAWTSITRAGRGAGDAWSSWVATRRLRPLWRAVVSEVPGITMEPGGVLARYLPTPRSRLLLTRMVVEIRDAQFALRPFMDSSVRVAGAGRARSTGLDSAASAAVGEACSLTSACTAHACGQAAARVVDHDVIGGRNLHEEVDHLLSVAAVWDSTLVREVLAAREPKARWSAA